MSVSVMEECITSRLKRSGPSRLQDTFTRCAGDFTLNVEEAAQPLYDTRLLQSARSIVLRRHKMYRIFVEKM